MCLKPCRYLEKTESTGNTPEGFFCAFFDLALRTDEDIGCCEGGYQCYESDEAGIIYEGRWMTLSQFRGYSGERIPDNFEAYVPSSLSEKEVKELTEIKDNNFTCEHCGAQVAFPPAVWPQTITCPKCGATYERID